MADVVGRAAGLDGQEQVEFAVVVDERSGAFLIGGQTDLNGVRAIVFATEERGAAVIANALVLGRLASDVEDGLALGAGAAPSETRNDFRGGEFVIDDRVQRELFLLEQLIQGFRLCESAGKAVQEEAPTATETTRSFADHFPNRGVRDQSAATHVLQGGGHGTRGRAIFAGSGSAKHVAGGEMAGAQALVEKVGLRAFADSGSAEEYETPRVVGLIRLRGTLCGRAL